MVHPSSDRTPPVLEARACTRCPTRHRALCPTNMCLHNTAYSTRRRMRIQTRGMLTLITCNSTIIILKNKAKRESLRIGIPICSPSWDWLVYLYKFESALLGYNYNQSQSNYNKYKNLLFKIRTNKKSPKISNCTVRTQTHVKIT